MRMHAANNKGIAILGAMILRFSGNNSVGDEVETRQILYVTDSSHKLFLSKETCIVLGMITEPFPRIGEFTSNMMATADYKNDTASATPVSDNCCYGRFGNQADHFLGALAFAHDLNRTLVLPHWVEYRTGLTKSVQVPFDKYFDPEPLKAYNNVILMDEFFKELAPIVWPRNMRTSFCYMSRGANNDCNAKEGNPFGSFWNTFKVDFVKSEFYGPLHYDTRHSNMAEQWIRKYPPDDFPVLAFTGAPASYPIQKENRILHKYLKWSKSVMKKARKFIKSNLQGGPFVGIHLRNGVDWVRACEHIKNSPNMFAAPQCLGYNSEFGLGTHDLCFPSTKSILDTLRQKVTAIKAINVFVASDNDHLIDEIQNGLQDLKIKAVKLDVNDPHVDLAILGLSNHFIGNCISSFSGFVKRERDVHSLPSSFYEFPLKKVKHDEF
ncbi:GDP-fucose protein O-fucosyltransferase 1 [Nymphon striatum]|nr:GDP-fucose protein O-fucosyltransferase 1 [Nymphon striatum]